ncbi:HEXXH motif domain-containing protein [Plantactinospora mayteni]|uniref:HEXXH motif domain-containing protein n=1 Tax=Plantactinospora mayteni TaxID=566021 RepID=A0ABQ4EUG8_9ACTN|nr:HEXXH motif domain-containing protein [Plantactinospora mayteni]GIG98254.1 HEXXH motif domain-containing protein [Plantactinospora mayteni]
MTGTHALTADQFAALATGGGDAQTIACLRISQLSKNILLIRAIMQTAEESYPDEYAAAGFADSFILLEEVQRHAAAIVADVLVHPQVGAWAGHCLRRLLNVTPAEQPLSTLLNHFAAIGAAAAIRAGTDFTATLTMDGNGTAVLPTLGRLQIPGTTPGTVTIRQVNRVRSVSTGDGYAVELPADLRREAPGWSPLRRLSTEVSGLRVSVDLDDIGPYRSGGEMPVTGRVEDGMVARWQETLDEAWWLLATLYPDRAGAMAAGLATLVPMEAGGPLIDSSATSRDAFGAVLLAAPESAEWLAETLVHEFQHSKLDAMLDLLPMYEATDGELFYSPARDDPRPLGGMLQGAYAYAGVADYWRRYRSITNSPHAQMQFARWREQVERVCEALLKSGRLTRCGVDLVTGMSAQMRLWDDTAFSDEQRAMARDAADDHYARWRIYNLHPDAREVSTLARRWLRGERRPAGGYTQPPPRATSAEVRINPRLQLRQRRELEPGRGAESAAPSPEPDPPLPGQITATAGDLAHLEGDHGRAVELYLAQISREPDNPEHWAGLILARRALVNDEATRSLRDHPELVRAVHLAVVAETGAAADPVAIAAWLPEIGSAPARTGRND